MSSLDEKIVHARQILTDAVAEYQPREIFALFSGGYDSLVTAHLAYHLIASCQVAHVNTGIGIRETREYVRATCRDLRWPLTEYYAPERYEDIVLRHGFPGPSAHRFMYIRLKERAIDTLIREHKTKRSDRIMLITGIRNQESRRRMGYDEPIKCHKAKVWVSPILNWSKIDVHAYKARYELPDNDVVQLLHMSGECLCGAYAHKGELAEIKLWYPETGAYIEQLEVKVQAAGHAWGWEEGPPAKKVVHPDQGDLFMPLCTNCELNQKATNHV